jgi:hypothetical protein
LRSINIKSLLLRTRTKGSFMQTVVASLRE